MTKDRNGTSGRWGQGAKAPRAERATLDAVADLTDYLTDVEQESTVGLGGEALVAVKRALLEGNDAYCVRAYALLERLKKRHIEDPGRDIPPNHANPNMPYATVLERLQEILENRLHESKGEPSQGPACKR